MNTNEKASTRALWRIKDYISSWQAAKDLPWIIKNQAWILWTSVKEAILPTDLIKTIKGDESASKVWTALDVASLFPAVKLVSTWFKWAKTWFKALTEWNKILKTYKPNVKIPDAQTIQLKTTNPKLFKEWTDLSQWALSQKEIAEAIANKTPIIDIAKKKWYDIVDWKVVKVSTEIAEEWVDKWASLATKTKEKPKDVIEQAKWTFNKYLSKDARIKTRKDKLSKLEKAYEKDKAKFDPQQQERIEEYIAKQKEEIQSISEQSWIKHLIETRKKQKIDKDLNKIANPDWFIKKSAKTLWLIWWLWLWWAIVSNVLSWDEDISIEDIPDAYEWLTESVNNVEDIPNPYTMDEEKEQQESKVVPVTKTTTNQIDTTKKENTSQPGGWGISAWVVYAQDWSPVPLLLMNGSYVVKQPNGWYYTLESWVTNENKRHKYTLAANKPLPF